MLLGGMLMCVTSSDAWGHGGVHGSATARPHVDICDLCCYLKPCWCPWSMLPPKAMLTPMVCVATRDHIEVYGPCWYWMSTVCARAGGHIDVHGSCYHWRPCRSPWSVLLPEVMLVSVACAATESHDGVCGLCWRQGMNWCLWYVLPPKIMWKSMICVAGACKGKWISLQWYWWLQPQCWEWQAWKACGQSTPPLFHNRETV